MHHRSLFATGDKELEDFAAEVIRMLLEIKKNSDTGLFPTNGAADLLNQSLSPVMPEESSSPAEVLAIFRDKISPLLFNGLQPRILQLMATPISLLAFVDLITSFLNIQPYPAVNQYLEKLVVGWLSRMVHYRDDCYGIMTSGGTISNLYALTIARVNKLNYNVRKMGIQLPDLVAYTSTECHSSIYKSIELLGIGRDNLRIIPSDDRFRIRPDLLEEAIRRDLEGHYRPFCIIANLGSVRTGSVDPIAALAEIADRYGLWLHIDGAYGAFGALCTAKADLFEAVHKADSITIDPHKWLNIPLESSCLLVRNKQDLANAFDHIPDYLGVSSFDRDNGMRYNFELTKSDRSLKTWFALNLFGIKSYREMITLHIEWIARFSKKISELDEFELCCEPELSICCFRYIPIRPLAQKKPADFYLNNLNSAIETSLKINAFFLMTSVRIDGVLLLRICVVNHRCTEEILETLIASLQEQGRLLDAKMTAA